MVEVIFPYGPFYPFVLMSGQVFAAKAREAFPSVGLVFATGNSILPDANHLPGSVLLSKPFSSTALDQAVKNAVQQRPGA